MIFQSYKPKIGKKLLSFIIALAITITALPLIQKPMIVYANHNYAGMAQSIVDSTSSNTSGGTSRVKNGVSAHRTGYLCYMLTKDGGTVAGTDAIALKSPGYSGDIPGSGWLCTSRKGGYSASNWKGVAPWELTPWQPPKSDQDKTCVSNEPDIKAWMLEEDSLGSPNAYNFVATQWGEEVATMFGADEYILVIETIMNLQWSVIERSGGSSGDIEQERRNIITRSVNKVKYTMSDIDLVRLAERYGYAGAEQAYNTAKNAGNANGVRNLVNDIKDGIVDAIRNLTVEQLGLNKNGKSYKLVGQPIIATVPNILKYKQSLGISGEALDSYTNKVAPISERILPGGPGERAGFKAWTGGIKKFADSEVFEYGLAMMVITAKSPYQTTCDEPQIPNPHNPPDESDGTKRIIKNYRTRNLTTNELTEDGNTFTIEEVSADILIEDEDTYTVVAWATSSGSSFIPSPTWESSIPSTGTLTQKGLSSGSVKLADSNEKTLYVLLEKPDSEEVEELDYNYLMTQSMITRTIWQNYPDEEGAGWEYLKDYDFTWTSAEHPKTCDGHSCVHDLGDDCEGDDTDGDGVDDITWCGGHDDTHPCKFNKYSDSDIKFSLYNYFKDDYPDILATKEGTFRGIEVPFGEEDMLLKRWEPFYSWNLTDRPEDKMHTEDIYETSAEVDWEYISVLMRGKDKLTVAQWANAGEAFYEATSANEDLKDASESGFEVANTKTGTRKTDVYYESFDEFFDTEGDVYTEVEPKDAASEGYCDHCDNKWHCTEGHNYILSTTMTVHVVVKLETYSGNPSGGYADNSLDDSEIIVFGNSISSEGFKSGSQNTHSGRQVKSGGSISFLPYTLMKYQTLASGTQGYHDTLEDYLSGWLRAYVLGQYYRSIIPNDYAEINWTRKSGDNLTLTSTQWSTHALATDAWGTNNVLPGGATLGLKIKESDRQHIYLTTYQCYVDGKGKNQCEVTGGTTGEDSGMSLADAQGNHSAFVYEFADALDNTNVQQWQNKNPHKDVAWDGGQKVNRNGSNTDSSTWDISRLDVSGTKTSSDSKYYFGDHYEGSGKGDYDVDVKETITHTYTFTSDVDGNIHMYIDNVSPSEGDTDAGAYSATAEIINDRTGVRDKLIAAVEQAVNGDYTLGDNKQVCSDEKALNGEMWYNEAFDGITVVVQETHIVSGFVDPFERTEILDPKLTKVQSSKSGQMGMSLEENDKAGRQATYELGQFKTREYSESYRMYQVMSSFKNKYVQMKDLEYLYWSRVFWIPNFTVQDIY